MKEIGSVSDFIARAMSIERRRCRKVVCADGAQVSIQASEMHYCTPRDNAGPYTHIEAGFPTVAPPESWMPYAGEPDKPLETVYGYMPADLVQEFTAAHGGMVDGELPPLALALAERGPNVMLRLDVQR